MVRGQAKAVGFTQVSAHKTRANLGHKAVGSRFGEGRARRPSPYPCRPSLHRCLGELNSWDNLSMKAMRPRNREKASFFAVNPSTN